MYDVWWRAPVRGDHADRPRRLEGAPSVMPIAADYPFLNIPWSMSIFFVWVAWIWMMVLILSDVFRRRDLSGWGKAGWTFF
jgi:hypothetical protein